MWFVAGAWLLLIGYGLLYTGLINLRNGGMGPSLSTAFGLSSLLPGAITPDSGAAGKVNPNNPPAGGAA